MPVQDIGIIMTQNRAIQINNKAAMDVWTANGGQSKKPTNKRTVEQTLACFCYKQSCRMSGSGKGCYVCLKKNGAINLIPDPNGGAGDHICDCSVCRCRCSISFPRSKYHDIHRQYDFEKQTKKGAPQGMIYLLLIFDISL